MVRVLFAADSTCVLENRGQFFLAFEKRTVGGSTIGFNSLRVVCVAAKISRRNARLAGQLAMPESVDKEKSAGVAFFFEIAILAHAPFKTTDLFCWT